MGKRDNLTEEQREAERVKNRERMARRYAAMSADERSAEAARRKDRETAKGESDPDWEAERRDRRCSTLRTYYQSRRDDPEFWDNRKTYLARWRKERRVDEEFEAFMERIESEAAVE